MVSKLVDSPKQDYYSINRKALIDMLIENMEFAVKWVPEQSKMNEYGMINKAACQQLLIKCYLAAGEFQKAKDQADILIEQSGYALMKNEFGTFFSGGEPEAWAIKRNVIWDLHRPENKMISANKESILGIVCRGSGESFYQDNKQRMMLPRELGCVWDTKLTTDPDGVQAITKYARNKKDYDKSLDYLRGIGRGIALDRPTWYATNSIWVLNGKEDKGDLRHSSEKGNWVNMENLCYNNRKSKYYGKTFTEVPPTCVDTVAGWFGYPLYKIYIQDQQLENNANSVSYYGGTLGSTADWYVYRLAETYLLRAEANFYLGHPEQAAKDVNAIRERALCNELYPEDNTFTIGDIMDERARELYCEEFRHAELSRVSYCLALSGKSDEWGNTYDVETYDKQSGTEKNGGSYWYQRIMHYNNYYNTGKTITANGNSFNYVINKHNLYWPIPNEAIKDNSKGKLAQSFGYDGYDPNVKLWNTWEEAVADEGNTAK